MSLAVVRFRRPEPRDLHVLHIGKTGGSALAHALEGARRREGGMVICHPHRVTLADLPPSVDIAFVLRDPITRIISGFYSRKRRGQPRYDVPWTEAEAEAFSRFPEIGDLAQGLVALNRDTHLAATDALEGIQHVRDRYWRWFGSPHHLRLRADDILFIARQERLDTDFEDLKRIAGLPTDCALPSDPAISHCSEDPKPVLSDQNHRILRAVTAQDYGFIHRCERDLGLRPFRPAGPPAREAEQSPTPVAASGA